MSEKKNRHSLGKEKDERLTVHERFDSFILMRWYISIHVS